jgi:formylglycine-generating enzyme required for sulfatase activity
MKGREFYKEVVVTKPGAPPVTFVLIPQKAAADPPTYYIMKYKVSNDLMAAWYKEMRPGTPWQAPANRLPAMGTTWDEADLMARWLGGLLPTPAQWDRAAALDRRPAPHDAAVNRREKGPRPVDEYGHDDVSPLGVCDMLGNGTEWTRAKLTEAPHPLLILRGQRWTAPEPLTLEALKEQNDKPNDYAQVQYGDHGSPFTGFRVVLEPPPAP